MGALTFRVNSFKQRDWGLNSIERLDIVDVLGGNIKYDICDNKVFRILGVSNKLLNDNWITDYTRYHYDAFDKNRLFFPLIKLEFFLNINYKYIQFFRVNVKFSWDFCLHFIIFIFYLCCNKRWSNFDLYLGNLIDIDALLSSVNFFYTLGVSNIWFDYLNLSDLNRYYNDFLITNLLKSFELVNVFWFFGVDLRLEYPLLYCRIRRNYIKSNGKIFVFSLGKSIIYNGFLVYNIGNNLSVFYKIIMGKCDFCFWLIKNLVKIFFLISSNFLLKNLNYLSLIKQLIIFLKKKIINLKKKSELDFFVLSNYIGRINYFNSNCFLFSQSKFVKSMDDNVKRLKVLKKKDEVSFLIYLIGVDDFDYISLKNNMYIYQGSFNDLGSFFSNVVIPSVLFVEKNILISNILGVFKYGDIVLDNNVVLTDEDIIISLSWYRVSFYLNPMTRFLVFYYLLKDCFYWFFGVKVFFYNFFFLSFLEIRYYIYIYYLVKRFRDKSYFSYKLFFKRCLYFFYFYFYFFLWILSFFINFLILKNLFKYSLNLMLLKKLKFKFNFFYMKKNYKEYLIFYNKKKNKIKYMKFLFFFFFYYIFNNFFLLKIKKNWLLYLNFLIKNLNIINIKKMNNYKKFDLVRIKFFFIFDCLFNNNNDNIDFYNKFLLEKKKECF